MTMFIQHPLAIVLLARKFWLWSAMTPILLSCFGSLNAQEKRYFKVNSKHIDVKSFERQIDKMLEETGIPAISLAVIDHDEVVYANAYGYKDLKKREPVDKETIFEACSLSKSLLAFIAYQLVDEGKLDLDKPMHHYFEPPPLQHDPRYKLITARMVLSHSSGLENWWSMNDKDTLEIISDPGHKFNYSGEGYTYLSKVIESLVGKPYEQYIPERVTTPLQLKRTYGIFKHNGEPLSNYAIGHNDMQQEVNKRKNEYPIPAAGVHITAEDYAKLVIAIFNGKNLSEEVLKQVLKPVVRIEGNDLSLFYGPGFEIFYTANDTLIAHGGNNSGFKAQMFYSVVNKKGFVFLSNSDLGKLITARLCEMTVGLDINSYFGMDFYQQYPSTALDLLNKYYQDRNFEALFSRIEKLKHAGKIDPETLNALGDAFADNDVSVSEKLLEENIRLHPGYPTAYFLLGRLNMNRQKYDLAYHNLVKARQLNFRGDLDNEIRACEEQMKAK